MARFIKIENGKAVNAIELDNPEAFPDWVLVRSDSADIGDEWDGSAFVVPTKEELDAIAAEEAERVRISKVPRTVTRRQARQALLLRGKLALVQPAIDAIPDATQRGLMQIEWDDSLSFDRDRPSLISIGAAIGYDSLGLDDVFTFAATL